jgi:hypothetical protein
VCCVIQSVNSTVSQADIRGGTGHVTQTTRVSRRNTSVMDLWTLWMVKMKLAAVSNNITLLHATII